MSTLFKSRVKEIASNKPNAATAFNLPDSAATGFRSFDSAYATNDVMPYHATNGTDWESGMGTFTADSPDTLARTTILESSTGSAIDWSAGADVTVFVEWPAALAQNAGLLMRTPTPGGRLTMVSGDPAPIASSTAFAISGQDTGADTVTITAHGQTTGCLVTSSATSGGITLGVIYYINVATANTFSLHLTAAAALAGTSKVDITGAVTANITFYGNAGATLYYSPAVHNLVPLWDGTRWIPIEFSETSLALGTMTASIGYDVFGYISSGALAIEKLAWTSATARATAITIQDGRYCKSGDKTRLYLGSFYSQETTTTEDNLTNRLVYNHYNQLLKVLFMNAEDGAGHTYNSSTIREYRAGSPPSRVNVFNGLISEINIGGAISISVTASTYRGAMAISENSTTTGLGGVTLSFGITGQTFISQTPVYTGYVPLGFNYYAMVESVIGTGTATYFSGRIRGSIVC